MAWKKQFTHPNTGSVGEFWEVIGISYNHRAQKSLLSVGCWVNKDAYDAEKHPMHEMSWEIPSGLAPQLSAGAVGFVTNYVRSLPEFEGSENI